MKFKNLHIFTYSTSLLAFWFMLFVPGANAQHNRYDTIESLKKEATAQVGGEAIIAVQKLIKMGEIDTVCDIFTDIRQQDSAARYLREEGKTTPRVDLLLLEHVKSQNHRIDWDEERSGRDVQTPLFLQFLAKKYGVSINDGSQERVESKRILLVEAALKQLEAVIPSGRQAPAATPTDGVEQANRPMGPKLDAAPLKPSAVVEPPSAQRPTPSSKMQWSAVICAAILLTGLLFWRRWKNRA